MTFKCFVVASAIICMRQASPRRAAGGSVVRAFAVFLHCPYLYTSRSKKWGTLHLRHPPLQVALFMYTYTRYQNITSTVYIHVYSNCNQFPLVSFECKIDVPWWVPCKRWIGRPVDSQEGVDFSVLAWPVGQLSAESFCANHCGRFRNALLMHPTVRVICCCNCFFLICGW